jgi:hypothetical protein
MADPRFGLLEAQGPAERLAALERFLEFWFGPAGLDAHSRRRILSWNGHTRSLQLIVRRPGPPWKPNCGAN